MDILGPKMLVPFFVINTIKIGEGDDIPKPRIGLPDVEAYINSPKTERRIIH